MGLVAAGALVTGRAGTYRVVDTVADGGMGVVYEAFAVESGERVAIKVLGEDAKAEESTRLRFAREISVNSRLRGRHVARVFDSGALETGAPFMVMELLVGVDLSRAIKQQGPLSIADASAVMVQVACGVAEAHGRGVVHRDLKPANVFLAEQGAQRIAKVIDFGVAKVSEGGDDFDDQLTRSFSSLGTPAYMSPEQIRSARTVDPATDVWSFSLVLYRALTGRLPFSGNASSVPLAICNDPPLSILTLRPEVPRDIVEVIEAGLEKDRRLRPTLADIGDVLVAHVDASADAAIAHDAYTELARMSLADLHRRTP